MNENRKERMGGENENEWINLACCIQWKESNNSSSIEVERYLKTSLKINNFSYPYKKLPI